MVPKLVPKPSKYQESKRIRLNIIRLFCRLGNNPGTMRGLGFGFSSVAASHSLTLRITDLTAYLNAISVDVYSRCSGFVLAIGT